MSSYNTSSVLAFACAALLASTVAGATQYAVGGDNGWGVPDANGDSYNTWAEKTSFQIGDQLLFVYPKDKDSVLLVQAGDYNACNTASYDKKFSDGSTAVDLDRAGAFFFISGVEANCHTNEKLIVMVAAAGKGAAGGNDAPSGAGGGANSTGTSSSPVTATGSNNARSGAGLTVAAAAGLAGSAAACIVGYAMLAL